MSNRDNGNEIDGKERALNRRNILLGGTTLAAASAFGASASCFGEYQSVVHSQTLPIMS